MACGVRMPSLTVLNALVISPSLGPLLRVLTGILVLSREAQAVLASSEEFNSCVQPNWVVYRSSEPRGTSFYACRLHLRGTSWSHATDACRRLGSSLATLLSYQELLFYYNAFQHFPITKKESGLSRANWFALYVNIRHLTSDARTVYIHYDPLTGIEESRTWAAYGDLPVPVYTPTAATVSSDGRRTSGASSSPLECAVLYMAREHAVFSYIEFGSCNESRADFLLCRKERPTCGEVPRNFFRLDHVSRAVGTYVSYESDSVHAQRSPKRRYVVERTRCERSCRGRPGTSGWWYYEGDALTYWCNLGSSTFGNDTRRGTVTCTARNWSMPAVCTRLALCPKSRREFACAYGGYAYTLTTLTTVVSSTARLTMTQATPTVSPNTTSAMTMSASVTSDAATMAGNETEPTCYCQCSPGRTGERCEFPLNECHSHPCKNGGTCRQNDEAAGEGYTCICSGAVGEHCEMEINECTSSPCVASTGDDGNGSWCIDELNGYRCICPLLRDGKHCEQEVPYCVVYKPCENGADCWSCNLHIFHDLCSKTNSTAFVCSCGPNFTGARCEVPLTRERNPWEIFAMVLGAILFVIVALACEIIGSRRRSEIDNLQVLLEAIGAFLKRKRATPAAASVTTNRTAAAEQSHVLPAS